MSRNSERIVIAGASSLLGGELKNLVEESRFAGWDLRLVDEEVAAGRLTEAAGEPAVIQAIEEDTFHGAQFAFLAGSAEFSKRCVVAAQAAGVRVIDCSGASLDNPDAVPWFPKIEALTGRSASKNAQAYCVFTAGATAVASIALALRKFGVQRMVAVLHQPVSEAGRGGIEELETQTSQLLSFQGVGQQVFGVQAAFNMLPRYGAESQLDLHARLLQLRSEVSAALAETGLDEAVSVNLLHVPVFYGATFSVCADLDAESNSENILAACCEAGFLLADAGTSEPNNVSVAGETAIHLAVPQPDVAREGSWWFWGAADNLHYAAASAIKLAESLL